MTPDPVKSCIYCDRALTTRTTRNPKEDTACARCQRILAEEDEGIEEEVA